MTFRSVDGLKLFFSENDRQFYLRQFAEYFGPVLDCFAFNLLDNHSHFVVRVKDVESLHQAISLVPKQFRTRPMQIFADDPSDNTIIRVMLERQVNSFMASYAKGTNKVYSRKGGLFQSPFRRSFIASDSHLQQAIIYTHANTQKHGIVKDFKDYPYTSYHEILAGRSKNVKADFVLSVFGGREVFIQVHERQAEHYYQSTFD